MELYIIYFVILAILAVAYERKPFIKWPFIVLVVGLLGVMAGFQGPNVSKDSSNYHAIFYSVDLLYTQFKYGNFFTSLEPGCLLIIVFLRRIFEINYVTAILVVFSFTSLILKSTLIKKLSINPFLVYLFYFSHYFFLSEMTQIRMGLATSIFFFAVTYLLEGKRIRYVFLILLATMFHYSAILYLAVLFISTQKRNRLFYLIIISMSIVFAFIRIPFFDYISADMNLGKFQGYKGSIQYMLYRKINPFNAIVLINFAFIFYLLFMVPKRELEKSKKMLLALKCNIVSIFLLHLFSGVPTLVYRFFELFGILTIFMFEGSIKYLPFGRYNIYFLILLAALFFYINLFYLELLQPYSFTPII